MTTLTLCSGIALVAATSAQAAVLVTSGDINIPGNWDTGALPGAGETGTVDINSSWLNTSNAGALAIFGDLVFGGDSTLTAPLDVVGGNPNSVTFNNVTVNVNDDIFTGAAGGNFIFNPGSVTVVRDDFEANAGGTITINGGMHTLTSAVNTSNFGAQNGSTLNFLGGTVTGVELFRATNAAASLTIGGDATLVGAGAAAVDFFPGTVAFNADWTGSLDLAGVSDWQATLIAAGATLDGVAIDATSFGEDFVVAGNNISLASAIPEPSALSLLGLSALFLAGRRSRK